MEHEKGKVKTSNVFKGNDPFGGLDVRDDY